MYAALKESIVKSENATEEERRAHTAWLDVHQVSLWIARYSLRCII